ncbi:MAG: hypothetical protein AVDCRST_MAG26-3187, partial [uncultured Chloroflexia bacterium]
GGLLSRVDHWSFVLRRWSLVIRRWSVVSPILPAHGRYTALGSGI